MLLIPKIYDLKFNKQKNYLIKLVNKKIEKKKGKRILYWRI